MGSIAIGFIALVCGAAAFAAFWHHIWQRNIWPSVASAFSLTVAMMVGDYVANDEMNAFAVPLFVTLFAVAFGVAMLVEFRVRRHRQIENVDA